ncbi:Uncharacterised protein [Halioglobus japonicus]|nr:Uncharacterised protein [Halioglobus japonicus]
MIRIITTLVVSLLVLWQGYLIYTSNELLASIQAMDNESPFSFFAAASIPFYIAFLICTVILGLALFRQSTGNRLMAVASLAICALGTGFMQLHMLYASYSPIFEASAQ